jgi:hypothetical protein
MNVGNGASRRDFFRLTAGAAAASLLPAPAGRSEEPNSRVVLIRRREAVAAGGKVSGPVVREMLDEAITALFGEKDVRAAWRRIAHPGDVVGVKSNAWSRLRTPPELEAAITDGLGRCGVKPEDISVDDRGVRSNPVFRRATAFVNVRPLRTHDWSGLGTCLKNVIMFVPKPSEYHADACASLGAIWNLPELKGKVRLNVLVLLTPQFHGVGPHSFSPDYVWPYCGLLVGTQPVPVDATGARIIAAKRREHFREERPISPPPHHIEIAGSRYGLGPSDPARIDLVRLGWGEGALI